MAELSYFLDLLSWLRAHEGVSSSFWIGLSQVVPEHHCVNLSLAHPAQQHDFRKALDTIILTTAEGDLYLKVRRDKLDTSCADTLLNPYTSPGLDSL